MHNDAIIDNDEVVICIININTEQNKSQVTNADGLVSWLHGLFYLIWLAKSA